MEEETVLHSLVTCQEAQGCWFASPLGLRIEEENLVDFKDWTFRLVTQVKEESKALIFALACAELDGFSGKENGLCPGVHRDSL